MKSFGEDGWISNQMTEAWDAFVSHSSVDKKFAAALVSALSNHGQNARSIGMRSAHKAPGWYEQINNGLRWSRYLLSVCGEPRTKAMSYAKKCCAQPNFECQLLLSNFRRQSFWTEEPEH